MRSILAYAVPPESPEASFMAIGIWVFCVLAAGALALLPIWIAWRRNHPRARVIRAMSLACGVGMAAIAIRAGISRLNWSAERALRVQSGYYDPAQNDPDAPAFPWSAAAVLACGYCGLIGWSLSSRAILAEAAE
jgi:hypothetical protein